MTSSLQGLSIFLVGMMGSGKSTVGKVLAGQLKYRFFDTDGLIEQVARQAIADIFETQGEAVFRQLENRVLAELAACLRSVVATGGGIVIDRANWGHLRQGLVVWLDAPIELLVDRLQEDSTRPLLRSSDLTAKLTSLLDERVALYREADLIVPVQAGQSPEEIAMAIIAAIPTVLKPPLEADEDRRSQDN